jgi:hypothetical protein
MKAYAQGWIVPSPEEPKKSRGEFKEERRRLYHALTAMRCFMSPWVWMKVICFLRSVWGLAMGQLLREKSLYIQTSEEIGFFLKPNCTYLSKHVWRLN